MDNLPELVLGSSSKYRKQILTKRGYNLRQLSPSIDEKQVGIEYRDRNDAHNLTLTIAEAKAIALKDQCPNSIIIASDQVIVVDGIIREKPKDKEQARQFLKSYGKHPAECVNAICLLNTVNGKMVKGVETSRQYFLAIPEDYMDVLIENTELMHCAGGFMVDHELFRPFVGERDGDESSIIGLSLSLFERLLKELAQ
jgi:septum formation protein